MKNIIVGALTLLIVGLMAMTAMRGGAYHGGEVKVISDMAGKMGQSSQATAPVAKDDRKIEQDKLKALRDKAGNIGGFKVSKNYKMKCASCHGINGEGIIGPKLIGLKSDVVYQQLLDYKAGRKENLVMKGLLLKLDEAALKEYADEIGEFEARAKAEQ
ncbi:MAG: c-type cytochrome [Campylobacterota bacterium]|nr:c-type cytochrome [Campylobacterota bacterium]